MPDALDSAIDEGLLELVLLIATVMEAEATLFSQVLLKEVTILRAGGLTDAAIFDTLLADAAQGGRIFGQFNNAIKSQIFGSVQKASHVGETAVYEERGIDTDMRKWVTVQGGNVCPDCQSREGQVEPYDFWEAIGLPGSGWSVCKQHCQCRLPAVAINAPDKVILESA